MEYFVEHFEKLIEAYEALLGAMQRLCLHIHDDLKDYPVWIDNGEEQFISDRDKVLYVLQHFSMDKTLTPQETFCCPGVVAATVETFALIDAVNAKKDEFKAIVSQYLDIFKENPTKPVRQVLAQAGYGGIKLIQVYRHIKKLDFHPQRISWSKAQTSSNVVINKEAARASLLKVGQGIHIDVQLAKLNLLDNSAKLVIYRSLGAYWLANSRTFKGSDGRTNNHKIRTSLPLFYLHNTHLLLPNVGFSKKYEKHKATPRFDKQIEEVPFLKSIKAYRYKLKKDKFY